MKANFILGKKQIILASLVLILGAAVYLNWQFASKDGDLALTDQLTNAGTQTTAGAASGSDPANPADDAAKANAGAAADAGKGAVSAPEVKNTAAGGDTADQGAAAGENTGAGGENGKMLGDAQLVSSKSIVDETYFAMAKLARTKSRDEAIQTVSTILDNDKLTETDKKEASEKAMAITDIIEAESRIENLIKAKGFEECVVYITSTSANVVVKCTDGLDQDQATQIKNIVVSEGKIKGENISITEIK